MDADTAITLDQAVDLIAVDEGGRDLAPVQQPASEDHYSPPHDSDADSNGGLTLDQAVEMLGDDEDAPALQTGRAVAAVVDGKPVSLPDLVGAYTLQHRLHAAAERLSGEYNAVQEAAEGVVNTAWELSRFMVAQMPPAPAEALAGINPGEYVRQKAIHEQAMQSVEHVISQAQLARESADDIARRYHGINLQTENAKLVQFFPETADLGQRQEFFNRMLDVAFACGFTRGEFEQVVDHRIFRLGALALKGMEAIAETPKQREKRRDRRKRYSSAMQKLARTGSIEDALDIDFE